MNSPESRPPVFSRPRPELRPQPPVAPAEQLPAGPAEAAPAAPDQAPSPVSSLPLPSPAADQPAERSGTAPSRPVVELPQRVKVPQVTRAYARRTQELVRETAADPGAQKDGIISLTDDFQEKVDSSAGV